MQEELQNFHSERDELYDETLQLQRLLEELVKEKMKLEQEMDWLSQKSLGYEAEARSLKEQNEMLSGKVCWVWGGGAGCGVGLGEGGSGEGGSES